MAGVTVIALLVVWQDAGAVMDGLKSLGWGVVLLPIAWLPNLVVVEALLARQNRCSVRVTQGAPGPA